MLAGQRDHATRRHRMTGDVDPGDSDPAGVRGQQRCQDPDQSGLARAVRSQQGRHLPFRDLHAQPAKRGRLPERLAHADDADFFCLNLLSLAGPLTAGQLAQQTGLTTGATTRMIDRLERSGFVRRGRDAADRRQVIVGARRHAQHDEIDAALEPARRRMQAVFQRYTAQEVHVLVGYFTHAAPALLAAVDDLRDYAARHGEPPGQPSPSGKPTRLRDQ